MSSFTITKEQFGAHTALRILNSETGEHAQILPSLGGAINSLSLTGRGDIISLVNGYPSAAIAHTELYTSYKGSSLFPFPNRIANGTYQFNNQNFKLPLNCSVQKNALHGLVYDKQFRTVSTKCEDNSCSITLAYSPSPSLSEYPFSYDLEQYYKMGPDRSLSCTTTVKNTDNCAIPIGHGWHPYFQLATQQIDDLYLQFPAGKRLEIDNFNIPTGKQEAYNSFEAGKQIGDHQFDDCFFLSGSAGKAVTTLTNVSLGITLNIWQQTGEHAYNYCQIYTPPGRRSIAIEPMSCAPDAFNNNRGLIVLQPDEVVSFQWGVSLSGR